MTNGVFSLRDYDALCWSQFGLRLAVPVSMTPSLLTESVNGDNRPNSEVQNTIKKATRRPPILGDSKVSVATIEGCSISLDKYQGSYH